MRHFPKPTVFFFVIFFFCLEKNRKLKEEYFTNFPWFCDSFPTLAFAFPPLPFLSFFLSLSCLSCHIFSIFLLFIHLFAHVLCNANEPQTLNCIPHLLNNHSFFIIMYMITLKFNLQAGKLAWMAFSGNMN